MPVHREPDDAVVYTGHDRPLVAVLIREEGRQLGVWCVGDLRMWRPTENGWEADITYTAGPSETRAGTYPASDIIKIE